MIEMKNEKKLYISLPKPCTNKSGKHQEIQSKPNRHHAS